MIAVSFDDQPAYSFGKHCSSTEIIAGTAVEAPGDAPRSPAMVPSPAATTAVPNSS